VAEKGLQGAGEQAAAAGRLLSRPGAPRSDGAPGLHALGAGDEREGYVYVPTTYRRAEPSPLILTLHGAGGSGRNSLERFLPLAERYRLILVAPDSRWQTWDVLFDGFGPDVRVIDRALDDVFAQYAVDEEHIAIEGFSDGASYAISLGLTNGDLFPRVIAFSPGFMTPGIRHGRPSFFLSHGVADGVLPVDLCSRRLVPELRKEGYDVSYREFDGGHVVPPELAADALAWFLGAGQG
jgi:phospholipase/carboxylesterase